MQQKSNIEIILTILNQKTTGEQTEED